MLSKLIRPVNILEIGRIPAILLCACAKECRKNGSLHTIDIKEELVDFQRKHFDKSSWELNFPTFREAVTIIPTLDLKFDLVLLMLIKKII
jgi:predicted O-methyltransferase YrrM